MIEITVPLCESFKKIGIDISEDDLRQFEKALYERGLNVAPRALPHDIVDRLQVWSDNSEGLSSVYAGQLISEALVEIRRLRALSLQQDATTQELRKILAECAADFHVCSRCGHQDDNATCESNLYLLLAPILAEDQTKPIP